MCSAATPACRTAARVVPPFAAFCAAASAAVAARVVTPIITTAKVGGRWLSPWPDAVISGSRAVGPGENVCAPTAGISIANEQADSENAITTTCLTIGSPGLGVWKRDVRPSKTCTRDISPSIAQWRSELAIPRWNVAHHSANRDDKQSANNRGDE